MLFEFVNYSTTQICINFACLNLYLTDDLIIDYCCYFCLTWAKKSNDYFCLYRIIVHEKLPIIRTTTFLLNAIFFSRIF